MTLLSSARNLISPDWPARIRSLIRALNTATSGWRFGIKACAISTFVIYILNLAITGWVVCYFEANGGEYLLYEGDCEIVAKYNTLTHLLINALSTILLGSSSYCMQCLSAPTREDVDAAHAKGNWLDVGILSPRNLARISRKRVGMWCLLGISSVPVHLLYNSVVFTTMAANMYWPIPVAASFLASNVAGDFVVRQNNSDVTVNVGSTTEFHAEAVRMRQLLANHQLEKLEQLNCINAYGTGYQVRGSVLLVLERNLTDGNRAEVFDDFSATSVSSDGSWIWALTTPCSDCKDEDVCPELKLSSQVQLEFSWREGDVSPDRVDIAKRLACLRRHSSSWSTSSGTISYCLSERVPKVCQLQASFAIAIIVIFSNLLTALVMFALANCVSFVPLLTIGDAIESFMEHVDPYTRRMCLAWRKDFEVRGYYQPWNVSNKFMPHRRRRFAAISVNQGIVLTLLYTIICIGIVYGLMSSITLVTGVGGSLKDFGMGVATTWTMVDSATSKTGAGGLISNSFLANVGQLALTLTYYSYNRIFTMISASIEWDAYAVRRKALRVSGMPRGEQRSTYLLSLPYRVALPLLLMSGLLHWLVSQAMFLVVIEYRHWNQDSKTWTRKPLNTKDTFIGCGFSPLAIVLLSVAVGLVLCILVVCGACRRMKSVMPVAGSCSAAIAAACHVPEAEDGQRTSISRVQWGVTGYGNDGIGHCAFSMLEVEAPEVDRRYE